MSPSELNREHLQLIYRVAFFTLYFCLGFFLFYHQSLFVHNQYPSDFKLHIEFIQNMINNPKLIIRGHHNIELGYVFLVVALSKILCFGNLAAAAVLVSSIALSAAAIITFYILKKELDLSDPFIIILTVCLMTLISIYVPYVDSDMHIGYGTPNIWHNPTTIVLRPFMLIVTYYSLLVLEKEAILKKALWPALLLFISCTIKPSFAICFIPALALYILLKYGFEHKKIIFASIVVLPTALLLVMQTLLLNSTNGKMIFTFFGVASYYTKHLIITTLLSIAFPLALLLVKKFKINRFLLFSWIITAIAYAEYAFLAQSGQAFYYGNFGWGFALSLNLLFLFSVIELVRYVKVIKSNVLRCKVTVSLLTVLLTLHFFSGVWYLLKVLGGGSYY